MEQDCNALWHVLYKESETNNNVSRVVLHAVGSIQSTAHWMISNIGLILERDAARTDA